MKICVAGAGIGGLTFILALQYFRRSLCYTDDRITLIEKAPSIKEGVGIVLNPNGIEVLDFIGLKEPFLAAANPIETISIKREHQCISIDLKEVWGIEQLPCSIPRKTLHELFFNKIKQKEVGIYMNCALEGIQINNSTVNVQMKDAESESFDLVVGADGVHSRVREICFPGSSARNTGLFYFRFISRNKMGVPSHTWQTIELGEGTFGFIPLSEELVHCFVQLAVDEYPCTRGEEELYFKKNITAQNALLDTAFAERCSPLQAGFAYMVEPENFYNNQVVLLGDAAHAVSPTLSEGAALAMEDALVLALALCSTDVIQDALQLYHSVRSQRCNWAYKMSLSQLNSLRNRRNMPVNKISKTDQAITTRLMTEIYKPFRVNYLTLQLKELLAKVYSNKLPTIIH